MIGAKIGAWYPASWSETAENGKRSKDGSCIPAERVCSAMWKRSWA